MQTVDWHRLLVSKGHSETTTSGESNGYLAPNLNCSLNFSPSYRVPAAPVTSIIHLQLQHKQSTNLRLIYWYACSTWYSLERQFSELHQQDKINQTFKTFIYGCKNFMKHNAYSDKLLQISLPSKCTPPGGSFSNASSSFSNRFCQQNTILQYIGNQWNNPTESVTCIPS